MKTSILSYASVFIGGGLGCLSRMIITQISFPSSFPFSTLLVNVLASFFLGISMSLYSNTPLLSLGLITGYCGGLSTFSTFAWENLQLLKSGRLTFFFAYTTAQLFLTLAGVWVGYRMGK